MADKRQVAGRSNTTNDVVLEEESDKESCLIVGEELDDGVYEVERVMERRKRKVCFICLTDV